MWLDSINEFWPCSVLKGKQIQNISQPSVLEFNESTPAPCHSIQPSLQPQENQILFLLARLVLRAIDPTEHHLCWKALGVMNCLNSLSHEPPYPQEWQLRPEAAATGKPRKKPGRHFSCEHSCARSSHVPCCCLRPCGGFSMAFKTFVLTLYMMQVPLQGHNHQ